MPVDPIVAALTARRQARGMSQRQLAIILRVSVATVGFWEQGQTVPGLGNLHDWAQALGMVVRVHEAAEVWADA